LKFDTDFRSVYATLLENWLCVDSATVDEVMGQYFNRIEALGLTCNAQTTSISEVHRSGIIHQARYSANGNISIYYELPEGNQVNLQIFNLLGQPVADLTNAYQSAGVYQTPFISQRKQLAKGQYFYRIQVGERAYSDAFLVR